MNTPRSSNYSQYRNNILVFTKCTHEFSCTWKLHMFRALISSSKANVSMLFFWQLGWRLQCWLYHQILSPCAPEVFPVGKQAQWVILGHLKKLLFGVPHSFYLPFTPNDKDTSEDEAFAKDVAHEAVSEGPQAAHPHSNSQEAQKTHLPLTGPIKTPLWGTQTNTSLNTSVQI